MTIPHLKAGTAHHRVIYHGATVSELAQMFNFAPQTVKRKINTLTPTGRTPNGGDTYSIPEAARYLVRAALDETAIEQVLRMNSKDLPPQLQKAFWDGKNAEVNYLERIGDLWDSKYVVELAGDAFKTLRLSLILLTDAVERETGLNEQQRAIIIRLVNASLEEMQRKLVDGFNERRKRSVGKSFAPVQTDGSEDL